MFLHHYIILLLENLEYIIISKKTRCSVHVFFLCYSSGTGTQISNIAWLCEPQTQTCQRMIVEDNVSYPDCLTSLNVCKLICDEYGSLWPLPTGVIIIEKTLVPINPDNIEFDVQISGMIRFLSDNAMSWVERHL